MVGFQPPRVVKACEKFTFLNTKETSQVHLKKVEKFKNRSDIKCKAMSFYCA